MGTNANIAYMAQIETQEEAKKQNEQLILFGVVIMFLVLIYVNAFTRLNTFSLEKDTERTMKKTITNL